MLTFMDMQTYDQIELAADFVGDRVRFLQDGMKVVVQMYEDKTPRHRASPKRRSHGRRSRRRGQRRHGRALV